MRLMAWRYLSMAGHKSRVSSYNQEKVFIRLKLYFNPETTDPAEKEVDKVFLLC